jgi:hypothetical protein
MNKIYWVELRRYVIGGRWKWQWQIKCRNGRVKAVCNTVYDKKSLCFNDASALANLLGMEVRVK